MSTTTKSAMDFIQKTALFLSAAGAVVFAGKALAESTERLYKDLKKDYKKGKKQQEKKSLGENDAL